MAELAADWKLGEVIDDGEPAVFDTVEYTDTVIPGDGLKVVGVTDDGDLKTAKQDGANMPRYICTRGGDSGDVREVLSRGTVKITFGSATTPGESGKMKANKIVANGEAGSSGVCCIVVSDAAADEDTGLIRFNGGMS